MLRMFLWISTFLGSLVLIIGFFIMGLNLWFIELKKEKYTDAQRWAAINWFTSWAVPLITRSTIKINGAEKLEAVEKGVVYANHQSIFDITSFLKGVNRPHGYIAKAEIGRFFLLRNGMPLIKCEFLERDDDRGAVKVILDAIKTVKSGHLMVIFPEGTREVRGPMGTFKAGSFKVAQKAKAAVIPVTFHNTDEVGSRWPRLTRVKVTVHDPIPYEAYRLMSTQEIATHVETIVKQALQ